MIRPVAAEDRRKEAVNMLLQFMVPAVVAGAMEHVLLNGLTDPVLRLERAQPILLSCVFAAAILHVLLSYNGRNPDIRTAIILCISGMMVGSHFKPFLAESMQVLDGNQGGQSEFARGHDGMKAAAE